MNSTANPSTQPIESGASRGLVLGALGIVFGDIGTSPLYAMRECFSPAHGLAVVPANIFGIVSIVFWTLILVVSIKYIGFLMRADNNGEGGILALMALVDRTLTQKGSRYRSGIMLLGILGAALLFGDAIITPSISVLSAIEGLNVTTSVFKPFVLPLSIGILCVLFFLQSRGTARVGALFGPILLIWFTTIGFLGIRSIIECPTILRAINPLWAVNFFRANGGHGFLILGSVFLCITGAEVLYADMGHFGRRPIRNAWFFIVFPCLLFNYFGQGARLIRDSNLSTNLFYQLAPGWFIYPLIIIATVATVIASQAVISGTFSLARQITQLGFWPRIKIIHTSYSKIGQVYVPAFNLLLFLGTIGLIIYFKESGRLANAYGIAVSATMFITTILALIWLRNCLKLHMALVALIGIFFLIPSTCFFISNIIKLGSGGWIVIAISIATYILMSTWRTGREILRIKAEQQTIDLNLFIDDIRRNKPSRVKGVAVFFTGNPHGVPRALLHNFKHNKILHATTIILTVKTEDIPFVSAVNRCALQELGEGLFHLHIKFGFSESPNVPAAITNMAEPGITINPMETTFFLGKESLIMKRNRAMPLWRKRIFYYMTRNALDASSFFSLPPNRVVELGLQVEL
jgi:KUP system potassium uptake protein